MTTKIQINCKNCMKDLHDECLNRSSCLCANNNHGVKKRDLTDSINDMVTTLKNNADNNERIKLDRLEKYGVPLLQIESYLNTTIKKDPTLVKQLVRVFLSAYTNNPINIALLSPSSDGKTYATIEVSKLFPKEDLILVGRLSPTALIHQEGFLIDEEGNSIEDALEEIDKIMVLAKQEDNKEEFEAAKQSKINLMKTGRKCVDLKNKILLFLDNPNPATYEMLKPIMSHDNKEIEYRTTKGDGSLKVSKTVIRNWPVFIFCSAKNEEKNEVWEEIKTRVFMTSPNSDIKKYKSANKLTGKKLSRPSWSKGIYENEEDKRYSKFYIDEIKQNLIKLCKDDNNPIINTFHELLVELFPSNSGVSMRHFTRLMSFINLETLLNAEYNPLLTFETKDDKKIKSVFTTLDNIDSACNVLKNISTTPPEKLRFYDKVFKPLYKEVLNCEGLTSIQVAEKYTKVFDKPITNKQVLESYLKPLEDAGILTSIENPDNKKQLLFQVTNTVNIHNLEDMKSKIIEDSKIKNLNNDNVNLCLAELEQSSIEIRKSKFIFKHNDIIISLDKLIELLYGNSQFSSKIIEQK